MRDELLNETLFTRVAHDRKKIAAWAHDKNTGRLQSSLWYATPAAFAADLTKRRCFAPRSRRLRFAVPCVTRAPARQ
jgi:putative transposase